MEEDKRAGQAGQKDGDNNRAETRKSPGRSSGAEKAGSSREGNAGVARGNAEKRSTSTKKK